MSSIYASLKERYLSYEDDLINDFYKPVMYTSKYYKRMAGYFSANLIEVLYEELKETNTFDNINIKLICSPQLSNEDKENISRGYAYKDIIEKRILREIDELSLDSESLPLITKLIIDGTIDIHFVISRSGNGIFHAKEGIFEDYNGNKLAFTGSNNETFSAVKHNFETTTVFYGKRHNTIINDIESLFDDIWNDENNNLYQINLTSEIKEKINEIDSKVKAKNIDTSQEDSLSLLDKIELFPYQKEALKQWELSDYNGLFEMATGTGKTITALACLEYLKNSSPNLLTIIVVPQIDLVTQWSEEINDFGGETINCNSESKGWQNKLKSNLNNLKWGRKKEAIVITTIETFKSTYFQKTLKNYAIKNSFLIVDEVHSFGAKQISEKYEDINGIFPYRLGVSATPFRKQDDESEKLINFFNKIVFKYTLEDAIKNGYLNEYEYYPIVLSFSQEELSQYRENFASKDLENIGSTELREIERLTSSIANASTAKINKLIHLLKAHNISNPKIVYCSPGLYNDGINVMDQRHIDFVQRTLGEIGCKLRVVKSGVSAVEREEILKQFKLKELDTLLAIKCLDQGVNLKSVTHAYILSSTDSLTEFIQRRGRILRIDENKPISKIYDLVMLPQDISANNFYPSVEDAYLVDRELRRMKEYNYASNNNSENEIIISNIEELYTDILEEYYAKTRSSN